MKKLLALSFQIVAHPPGVAPALAEILVSETPAVCPYSKAFTHGAEVSLLATA